MRIAIDGRELAGHATGVGRYLAEVLRAWNDLPEAPAHEFVVCTHAPLALPALPRLRLSTVVSPGAGGTWWEQTALPRLVRAAKPDVLFAPAYTAPIRCRDRVWPCSRPMRSWSSRFGNGAARRCFMW